MDIMKQQLATEEMGKYLVLELSFSAVAPDENIYSNFCKYINITVKHFSEKYYNAGLLDRPIEINPTNALRTLQNMFEVVKLSEHKVYLIVDEYDAFATRLVMGVDIRKTDLGQQQYMTTVVDKEAILRSFGETIKKGVANGVMTRAYFTGVMPVAFGDGLDIVQDITFMSQFEGMLGLTAADIVQGLRMIPSLTEQQRAEYLQQIRLQYEGYRFVRTQQEAVFNPQYVLYFLQHVQEYGESPSSMVDLDVSGYIDSVAEYLIQRHRTGGSYTLQNFVLGNIPPGEFSSFEYTSDPEFYSAHLFCPTTASDSLISLAYFHGFLTFPRPHPQLQNQRAALTVPNMVTQIIFTHALFQSLPCQRMEELETMISSGKADLVELSRIVGLGIHETCTAKGCRLALSKVTGEAALSTDSVGDVADVYKEIQ